MAEKWDTEQQKCAYKMCTHPDDKLSHVTARVEVKSYVPERVNKKQLLLDWEEDGQARLHMDCWDEVVKASKMTGPGAVMTLEEQEMVKEARKTAEFFNSYSEIKTQAKHIASMILSAKHATVFTGAGISTSAGIGDFRGKGGQWTENDRVKKFGKAAVSSRKKKGFSYAELRPTYTHEAIAKLVDMGLIKYVISQNCDGIHRLSGINRDKISELHGNVFHEKCETCDARYERPYYASSTRDNKAPPNYCRHCKINHRTGRKCERKGCDGYLMNTIINFGDGLEFKVLDLAVDHCQKKDLMLCLGSSLTVTPACNLVEYGEKPLRIVICNRQPTQYDNLCYEPSGDRGQTVGSRVFGDCDDLMKEVMKCILPEDQLSEWEEGREARMKEYDKQRV